MKRANKIQNNEPKKRKMKKNRIKNKMKVEKKLTIKIITKKAYLIYMYCHLI